jgi:hypothetical protein
VSTRPANPTAAAPPDVTTVALESIGLVAQVLAMHEGALKSLVDAHERFDAIGFAADPTFYRQLLHSRTYQANIRMARRTLEFLAAAKAWREESAGDEPGRGQVAHGDATQVESPGARAS